MALCWPNATKIVNQLGVTCLLSHLLSNKRLQRNVRKLFSLKKPILSSFYCLKQKKSIIGCSEHTKTYIFVKTRTLSYLFKAYLYILLKNIRKYNFSEFYPVNGLWILKCVVCKKPIGLLSNWQWPKYICVFSH